MAIQLRRHTTAEWAAAPWSAYIPADGEPIVEMAVSGHRRWKLGDGAHTFSGLPYQGETSIDGLGEISPIVEDLLAADDQAAARGVLGAVSAGELAAAVADAVATLSVVVPNPQTGTTYTLALSDAGKAVEMNNAAANTVTVPPNSTAAFPVGTVIEIYQVGAGQTTIVAGAGVSIPYSKKKLAGQYSVASLRKRATDEWVLAGDLVA